MANNEIFTFTPQFTEFLPLYQNVSRVWIGNGTTTGKAGMLYAGYEDGNVIELGSVSLYSTAVELGYEGTEREWLNMIMSVSDMVKGSEIHTSYQISNNGTVPPSGEWSSEPIYEKGKFTWTKIDLVWIDRTTTTICFPAYQGMDGQVESINGSVGHVIIHGDNLHIEENSEQTIKEYIDENDILNTATDDEIDALFSMVFFSGAAFITGRRFEQGDSITYKLEAITPNAPMPQSNTTTISPTGGNCRRFQFGYVTYDASSIPSGQTSATYQYRISEQSHTLDGIPYNPSSYTTSVTVYDNGDGTFKIEKDPNFNSMYFAYEYSAMGRIVFQGSIQLNGRMMAAREFAVQIKEGDEIIAENVSTLNIAAEGAPSPISFPPINYTMDDIGTHVYTVLQTSPSINGVTVSDTVYTVTVEVLDEIKDGTLEIITHDTEKNLNFINTYNATGVAAFLCRLTLSNRSFRYGDSFSVTVTGPGKLPNPATKEFDFSRIYGQSTVDVTLPLIKYDISDMANSVGGHDDVKTIVYTITETANMPGIVFENKVHTVTIELTDNKRGVLQVREWDSDGSRIEFSGTYNAYGSIIFSGEKRLVNRNFVAADTMYAIISSSNGKLPYYPSINVPLTVGQNIVDFSFLEVTYELADLGNESSRTFNYLLTEDTRIQGATNDTNIHTVDVYVEDNHDGTLNIVPTYSDGNKASFVSTYNAVGHLTIVGAKTIRNRTFNENDSLSVYIVSENGKLPAHSNVVVPLTTDSNNASFSFDTITYNINDLNGQAEKTFNYKVREIATMSGTTPDSVEDTMSVVVSDNADGTLNITPHYTANNHISLENVYSATGRLEFRTCVNITNVDEEDNGLFYVRLTQVTGNNSETPETNNVIIGTNPITVNVKAREANRTDLNFHVPFFKNSQRDDTQNAYWFMINQYIPTRRENFAYDEHKTWIRVSVSDNLNGTLSVTKIPAQSPSTGYDDTFTNEQLGAITINKVWNGEDARYLTQAQKNNFMFEIKGPNSYLTLIPYNLLVNNSIKINDLKFGSYTVTEKGNTIENYDITTTYSVDGTSVNTFNLTKNGSIVTVTNAVTKLVGNLTVYKQWLGDSGDLTLSTKERILFRVTGPKQTSTDSDTYSREFTYASMVDNYDRMTLTDLTPGTYTVTELNNNVDGYDVSVNYQVGVDNGNQVLISAGDNKTMSVYNTYTRQLADVRVFLTFNGITADERPEDFYIVNNYNQTEFNYTNTYTSGDGISNPLKWRLEDVPVGRSIKFTVKSAKITGYTLDTISDPANGTCTVAQSSPPVTVNFTCTYTQNT